MRRKQRANHFDRSWRTALTIVMSMLCATLAAQTVHETWNGFEASAQSGRVVEGVGDIDRDGHADVAVAAPFDDGSGGTDAGRVVVSSGRTGATLFIVEGDFPGRRFGIALAGAGDMDGDGYRDVAIGWDHVSNSSSGFRVYSGVDGSLLFAIQSTLGDDLGTALAGVGDVNGDGRDNLCVGAPAALSNRGQVRFYYYSTAVGGIYWANRTLDGAHAGANLGTSVAAAGDINGDGTPDAIVGEPCYTYTNIFLTPFKTGRVRIVSGLGVGDPQGQIIRNHVPSTDYVQAEFGFAVDGGVDITGDGVPDYIVGAPNYDAGLLNSVGRAIVYSGSDGSQFAVDAGPELGGERHGYDVAMLGDSDGDGNGEVVIAAPFYDEPSSSTSNVGRVVVLSFLPIFTTTVTESVIIGDQAFADLGWSIARAGDTDGDGMPELLIGAPFRDTTSTILATQSSAGQALLCSPVPLHTPINGLGVATVARAGDVDGDGGVDYLFGAPGTGTSTGSVRVVRATNGSTVHVVSGTQGGERFGTGLDGVGDIDGDGHDDFAVGSPLYDAFVLPTFRVDAGILRVYSGIDGALIPSRTRTGSTGDRFGHDVCALGDVDGDGIADYAVSAPRAETGSFITFVDAGRVDVISGFDGTTIRSISLFAPTAQGGWAIDAAGDVNGDGTPDIVIGSPFADHSGGTDAGRVEVRCALTGATIQSYAGTQAFERLGYSVAGVGDVDGDGVPDFAAGAPRYDSTFLGTISDRGRILVFSGATGSVIRSRVGAAAGDQLGHALAGIGDADRDGRGDYVAGAPFVEGGYSSAVGAAYVYSGGDGSLIATETGFSDFGRSLAGLGDVDGDCYADFVVGHQQFALGFVAAAHVVSLGAGLGLELYGEGTPGCFGPMCLSAETGPVVNNQNFAFTCSNARPFGLGALFAVPVAGRLDPGQLDSFGIGITLHVDTSFGVLSQFQLPADGNGFARVAAPVPDVPALAGFQFCLQAFYNWGPTCPGLPFGWSSTNGLEVTILP